MPQASIIVPVHNKAEFLDQSIPSLLDQTLKDIEVILVNDGSTDGSLEILRRFKAMDDRIRLIDQPNGGVSQARNAGLEAATGSFIGFMDPDDWVEPDMYRSMQELAGRTGAEVCLTNFYFERAGKKIPVILEGLPGILDKDRILSGLILNMLSADPHQPYKKETMGSVFRLLIRKEHIQKHGLKFRPGLAYMEDLVFTVGLLAHAKKAAIDPGLHYHYRVQAGSASKKYIPGLFDLLLEIQALLEKALKEAGVHEKAGPRLEQRMAFNALRAVINETHADNPATPDETLKEIRRIISCPRLLESIPRLDLRHMPEFRRQAVSFIQAGRAEALLHYFQARPDTLDPAPPS